MALAWFAGMQAGTIAIQDSWTRRTPPFKVIDNIYYVGTEDLASYLITSTAGHVLIDSGVAANAQTILDNIATLGFKAADLRLLLTTQAHFDHVAAFAELKKRTGAQIAAAAGDAPVLEDGGKSDFHLGAEYNFPPVVVDRLVKDSEVVKVGTISLTARLTPGHTKGTTTWTMQARDARGQPRQVVFLGSTSVNPGVRLVNNEKYPSIAEDFTKTFAIQKALTCEVFLAAHASMFDAHAKAKAAAGGQGDAAFVDPAGCRAAIERSEKAFLAELARQRGSGQAPPRRPGRRAVFGTPS
jgi:metallo-beta-lactamase class B